MEAMANNPFHSERLTFRAVEFPDDNELFQSIQSDAFGFQNSNARLKRPQSRKDAAEYQKEVAENTLLGVVICIPGTPTQKAVTAIGTVFLKPANFLQHRFTELGIDILAEHQGKGYGTEAISWALDWAFDVAGLHRVSVRAFEWNYGARKLYERIGFRHEGTAREELFHNGKWWDGYQYGILDREWRQIRANKTDSKVLT